MKHTYIITALMMLCIHCNAFYPNVKNHDRKTYGSGPQNWCIVQTGNGSMAFANNGILEYDGIEWKQTMSSNHSSIRSLLYDKETERIYFGATDEFGYIGINDKHQAEYVSLRQDLDRPLEEIWAIHKKEKSLWIRENSKIYKIDSQKIKQFSFSDKISCSTHLGDQIIIFISNSGAFATNDEDEFIKIPATENLKDKKICAILPYGSKDLLFVSSTSGIFRLHNGKILPFNVEFEEDLKKNTVFCATANEEFIAFGTVSDGVFIKNIHDGSTIHLNTFSGLQNNTVLSLFFDNAGNLWLGLDKGIDMVELASPEYRLFGNPDIFGAGYASAIYNGKMWIGTNQGLYSTDYPLSRSIMNDDAFTFHAPVKGQVWSLLAYEDKLFCCHDLGLYIIDGNDITHIPMNGVWKLEPLMEDPGTILGSSYDRLFLLRKSGVRWKFDCWLNGFEDASKAFEQDRDGYIWFSHWLKGLFRFRIDSDSKSAAEVKFFSKSESFPEDWGNVPIDIKGDICFSTAKGYYMFNEYSGKAYPYHILNNLFSTPPASTNIYISPYGDRYFSSGNMQAIFYKDKDGREILDTLSLKGLASKRIKGFEDIRSISEKEIMVNTEDGFSIIRKDKLGTSEETSKKLPYIKEIHIRNREKDSLVYFSRGAGDPKFNLTLPYRLNTLRFKAVYPSYSTSHTITYSFLLENYEKEWSQHSESGSKEYTKLPHGNYVLHVKAKDALTDIESECSIPISITAPWYRSKAAYVIYIAILLILIMLTERIIQILSDKRARQLAAKQKEEMMKEQMRRELEHKAQDLAASTMNVIRKNEILLDIDAELELVAENMAENRNKSLKILSNIRHEIRENIQHDDDWQKFERNFDIVYDDFLQRLSMKYPHLTVSDKKMCAYLKMGLSSKEIAPLLNITLRSVEMTRYRLRKKLGLSHEDNLTEFLHKF